MDTLSAWGMAQLSRGREMKVFDWDKAAKIIKERKPVIAEAGLESDYEWTLGPIYENGKRTPERGCTYLISTWATPMLIVDGDEMSCYKMQSEHPEWNDETWWPKSAVEILAQ
jgi:hypothetical protein